MNERPGAIMGWGGVAVQSLSFVVLWYREQRCCEIGMLQGSGHSSYSCHHCRAIVWRGVGSGGYALRSITQLTIPYYLRNYDWL